MYIIKPNHIGIIMDGNRRFAKSLKLSPWKGHEYGEKKLFSLLEWCRELNIKEVTVYAFSVQNMDRPKREFDYLMNLFSNAAKKILADSKFLDSGVKIRVLGDLNLFPQEVKLGFNELIDKTKHNNSYIFNIAFGYGGREEILRAVKNIALDINNGKLNPEEIDESVFESKLYMSSNPDLIIRTGGDFRTSNFLPWQSVYSEWYFTEKKWPEFNREDLIKCVNEFSLRERRFGK